ncbi:MAG: papain-like cysteine protease family protein [Bacteroidota bacterium]|nr:papain-like cysteine protease family protein [Bacteroidota bacterium]
MNYKSIFFKLVMIISLCLSFSDIKAQILDVPYRNDITGCGQWCWAMSDQMVIVYYGNNVQLCDVLEVARQNDPNRFGTVDCCVNPFVGCCNSGYISSNQAIINHWSISNSFIWNPLSLAQVQSDLQNNRPIVMHLFNSDGSGGHTVVGYGLSNDDVYIQNPGNGSQIRDYTNLTQGASQIWSYTNRMNTSATACMLTQTVSGTLNSANSTYKTINSLNVNCIINNNSNIVFLCSNEVLLEAGFEIQSGASLLIETGISITCP